MSVVLDCNILFRALISQHGPPHEIYQAWRKRRFTLITADVQIDELRRASRYPKFRDVLQPHRVGRLLNDLREVLTSAGQARPALHVNRRRCDSSGQPLLPDRPPQIDRVRAC